jgi:hypothetical protein
MLCGEVKKIRDAALPGIDILGHAIIGCFYGRSIRLAHGNEKMFAE